jgi:abortive infection bacteriophage resistance protein
MEAPQGGYFLSSGKLPYAKPPISILQQLSLLQSRGMEIADADQAHHYLKFVGYYRLSGYFRFYGDPADEKGERFVPGTTFQAVLDLYVFDRKIRVLLLDALERIEVAARAEICNTGALNGKEGAFWLNCAANFDHGQHNVIAKILAERAGTTQNHGIFHQFIVHFFKRYADQTPPSWMAMEAFSFGDVSVTYKKMKGELRSPIASSFKLQHDILESWLHALAFGRNICAHHARVWNRTFTIKPKIPKQYLEVWPRKAQDRLYTLCCVIHHMMNVIADGSAWSSRLRDLVDERPNIPLDLMGFPLSWKDHSFWGFQT